MVHRWAIDMMTGRTRWFRLLNQKNLRTPGPRPLLGAAAGARADYRRQRGGGHREWYTGGPLALWLMDPLRESLRLRSSLAGITLRRARASTACNSSGRQHASCMAQVVGAGDETGHSRLTHKACLERYRQASGQIMGLLRSLTPNVSRPPHL